MKKVIIIGAGPAGLTAAFELLKEKEKYDILILEEDSQVGGIAKTINVKGNRMDIGGHRFFSRDDRINALWEQWLPTEEKQESTATDAVMLRRQRVSRIFYDRHFYDYPVQLNISTITSMGIAKTLKAGVSYFVSCIHKRKENNLEDFYCNRFGQVLYSMFFEGYTQKLWGRHPREISGDWGAQRVKGLSVSAVIRDFCQRALRKKNRKMEISLIEEFYYPKFGPGQLWETVADKIGESVQIRLNCKVKRILCEEKHRISGVIYENAKGKEIFERADILISSMPLKDLTEGLGACVPQEVKRVAHGLPYRSFVTVGLLVPSLKIKNHTKIKSHNDLIPDCWIYVQDTGVKLGRIQVFNNWSPYMVKDPDNTVFLGLEFFCNEGDEFWNMTEECCVRQAVCELKSIGILEKDCTILLSHTEKVKKAYPAYFDTYKEIDRLIAYLNNFDNLYCIGRNGQHRYNNMDHSMLTAMEAVCNISCGNKNKDNIWKVNAESVYHEKK